MKPLTRALDHIVRAYGEIRLSSDPYYAPADDERSRLLASASAELAAARIIVEQHLEAANETEKQQ